MITTDHTYFVAPTISEIYVWTWGIIYVLFHKNVNQISVYVTGCYLAEGVTGAHCFTLKADYKIDFSFL